jgi:hypothetical protein
VYHCRHCRKYHVGTQIQRRSDDRRSARPYDDDSGDEEKITPMRRRA